jgi:hypothetical protein
LSGSNYATYEQEHDNAESNGNQAHKDHYNTIEDIHSVIVFLSHRFQISDDYSEELGIKMLTLFS